MHLAWADATCATPRPRLGAEAGRTPCPRGGGQEELPHIRGQGLQPGGATSRGGVVAAWAQKGLEELFHVQGQKGKR